MKASVAYEKRKEKQEMFHHEFFFSGKSITSQRSTKMKGVQRGLNVKPC